VNSKVDPVIETFLAVKDLQIRDQIRMAFRLNAAFRVSPVPREELLSLIGEPAQVDLVIVDAGKDDDATEEQLGQIRQANPRTAVVLVGDRTDAAPLHRAKLEHGVHTVIQTPIDPFDLARRIFRLHAVMSRKAH
jgi:AmiR/NasT family two-component response regulator